MAPAERKVHEYLDKHPGNAAVTLLQAIESGTFTDPETIRLAAKKAQAAMQQGGTWMPDFSGTNKTRLKHRDRSRKIRDIIEGGS
jgi:hypothetical protein